MKDGRWLRALDTAATVLMIVSACAVLWAVSRAKSVPTVTGDREAEFVTADLSLRDTPSKGNPRARLAVLEYADFQCPFCQKFWRETLPTIITRYVDSGKLLFAFRHLPIPRHEFASEAALAAECARQQGKFWPMHDSLFSDPPTRTESHAGRAAGLGLDTSQFAACMAGQAIHRIEADLTEARRIGVTGAPTFLFGSLGEDGHMKVLRRRAGAMTLQAFDELLADIAIERTSADARQGP